MSFLSVLNDNIRLWASQAITPLNSTSMNKSLPIAQEAKIWESLMVIGHTGVHGTK